MHEVSRREKVTTYAHELNSSTAPRGAATITWARKLCWQSGIKVMGKNKVLVKVQPEGKYSTFRSISNFCDVSCGH